MSGECNICGEWGCVESRHTKLKRGVLIALATLLGLLSAFIDVYLTRSQPSDAQVERELYCEMTELYKDTGGQYGWPSYKGEC